MIVVNQAKALKDLSLAVLSLIRLIVWIDHHRTFFQRLKHDFETPPPVKNVFYLLLLLSNI